MPYSNYISNKFKRNEPTLDDYDQDFEDIKNRASASSLEAMNTTDSNTKEPMVSPDVAKATSRGMTGGIGSALASGGITSMLGSGGLAGGGPYALAGGLALSAMEQHAAAKNAEEDAKALEAQNRKQSQLTAINNLIGVSKGLSVMG